MLETIDSIRAAIFALDLLSIDEDEARWVHQLRTFQLRTFDIERQKLVHRFMPLGTRVRWKQTETRDTFEAEGVVSKWATSEGECENVICAGVSRKWSPSARVHVPTNPRGSRSVLSGAWVTVRFTKHPGLERRLVVEGPLLAQILVLELERL